MSNMVKGETAAAVGVVAVLGALGLWALLRPTPSSAAAGLGPSPMSSSATLIPRIAERFHAETGIRGVVPTESRAEYGATSSEAMTTGCALCEELDLPCDENGNCVQGSKCHCSGEVPCLPAPPPPSFCPPGYTFAGGCCVDYSGLPGNPPWMT